jgi:hypothetical protein
MRIVIGEDSVLFREGLAHLLTDAGHHIVAKLLVRAGTFNVFDRLRHSEHLSTRADRGWDGASIAGGPPSRP